MKKILMSLALTLSIASPAYAAESGDQPDKSSSITSTLSVSIEKNLGNPTISDILTKQMVQEVVPETVTTTTTTTEIVPVVTTIPGTNAVETITPNFSSSNLSTYSVPTYSSTGSFTSTKTGTITALSATGNPLMMDYGGFQGSVVHLSVSSSIPGASSLSASQIQSMLANSTYSGTMSTPPTGYFSTANASYLYQGNANYGLSTSTTTHPGIFAYSGGNYVNSPIQNVALPDSAIQTATLVSSNTAQYNYNLTLSPLHNTSIYYNNNTTSTNSWFAGNHIGTFSGSNSISVIGVNPASLDNPLSTATPVQAAAVSASSVVYGPTTTYTVPVTGITTSVPNYNSQALVYTSGTLSKSVYSNLLNVSMPTNAFNVQSSTSSFTGFPTYSVGISNVTYSNTLGIYANKLSSVSLPTLSTSSGGFSTYSSALSGSSVSNVSAQEIGSLSSHNYGVYLNSSNNTLYIPTISYQSKTFQIPVTTTLSRSGTITENTATGGSYQTFAFNGTTISATNIPAGYGLNGNNANGAYQNTPVWKTSPTVTGQISGIADASTSSVSKTVEIPVVSYKEYVLPSASGFANWSCAGSSIITCTMNESYPSTTYTTKSVPVTSTSSKTKLTTVTVPFTNNSNYRESPMKSVNSAITKVTYGTPVSSKVIKVVTGSSHIVQKTVWKALPAPGAPTLARIHTGTSVSSFSSPISTVGSLVIASLLPYHARAVFLGQIGSKIPGSFRSGHIKSVPIHHPTIRSHA